MTQLLLPNAGTLVAELPPAVQELLLGGPGGTGLVPLLTDACTNVVPNLPQLPDLPGPLGARQEGSTEEQQGEEATPEEATPEQAPQEQSEGEASSRRTRRAGGRRSRRRSRSVRAMRTRVG